MKLDIELTQREQDILSAVVDLYVKSAEPVGSRVISQRLDLGLSPATIRNTMQDLEERGLLKQPHTSAGRVPTDLGYRFYVDRLLRPEPLTRDESDVIRREMDHDPAAIQEILAQTSKVLSKLTNQLGVTIAPALDKGILAHIDLVQVASHRVLMIISVKSGLARTLLLEMDTAIPTAQLEVTQQVLNERLVGLTLGELRTRAAERLRDAKGEPRLIKMFLDSSEKLVHPKELDDLHLGGTVNIMHQPEFQDIGNLSELMSVIENRSHLLEWMSKHEVGDGIVITIGRELQEVDLQQCAMVTSTYQVGRIQGTIGVLGPTRMPYSKLVSVVDYTSRLLTEILSPESD
jgi:heat-inducible transcriptional repressor